MPESEDEIMKPLGLMAVVFILPIAYAMSVAFEKFVYPGHGNIFGVSFGISLISIYQSLPIIRSKRALLFLAVYIILNLCLPFFDITKNENFYILIGLPWALLDYAAFVFGMYAVYGSKQ